MRFDVTRGQLEAAVDAAGLEPEVLHLDYSGRAMYGSACPAVYVDGFGEAAAFLAALAADAAHGDDYENYYDAQEVIELARTTRTDGMGRGIVAYWPNLQVLEAEPT